MIVNIGISNVVKFKSSNYLNAVFKCLMRVDSLLAPPVQNPGHATDVSGENLI